MKFRGFLLAILANMSLNSALYADSYTMEDAFKNGDFKGDITLYFEDRHITAGKRSTYYNNTSWAVGSIGLNYHTDSYYNLRFATGFRGTAPVYEDDREFQTLHGIGDSTERIYRGSHVLLSRLYFEYEANNTILRVGRQEIDTDWVTKINDAVRIMYDSDSDFIIEAIWIRSQGRAYAKEMWDFKHLNEHNGGVSTLGITYQPNDFIAIKGYGIYAFKSVYALGGKANLDFYVSEELAFGAMSNYAVSEEGHSKHNGCVFENLLYLKSYDTKITFAHVRSGRHIGWGSLDIAGNKIVPFEEGDVMHERDARTTYGMLTTKFDRLSFSGAYGTTEYKLRGGDNTKYRQNEVSIWLDYDITKNLHGMLVYDTVHKPQPQYPSLNQISISLNYNF